jgi:hypothetical protein
MLHNQKLQEIANVADKEVHDMKQEMIRLKNELAVSRASAYEVNVSTDWTEGDVKLLHFMSQLKTR